MKKLLQNLLMGTALAVSSIAFADAPFTVTKNFEAKYEAADLPTGCTIGEMRTGTGVNGKIYVIDKSQAKLFAIDANGFSEGIDVPGITGCAITADDAGNLLVSRGWPNAASTTYLSIIPANGSARMDFTAVYPNGVTPARIDNFGRMVGDMMSVTGAIVYFGNNGSDVYSALHISAFDQVWATFEYGSTTGGDAAETCTTAVPMYNTIAEQLAADPNYDAFYAMHRSNQNIFTMYSGSKATIPRPTDTGIYFYGKPGFDTFVQGGKRYFVRPYTTQASKYSDNFLICDEAGTLLYKTDWDETFSPVGGSFNNGDNIVVRKVNDYKFEIYSYQSTGSAINVAYYTLNFPEPAKAYLVGEPSGWTEPVASNAATYADFTLTETVVGNGIYHGAFNIEQGKGMFRIYMNLDGWDNSEQYGAQEANEPVNCSFTNGVFESTLVSGKGSLNFASWNGGTMDITFDYNTKAIKIVAAENEPTLYITGAFDNWALDQKMTVEKTADEVIYTYTLPENFANLGSDKQGQFKIATANWAMAYGNYNNVTFQNGVAVEAYASNNTSDSNMTFNVANATDVVVKLILSATDYTPKTITLTWSDPSSGIEDVAADAFEGEAVYYNLNGTRVNASDLSSGIYIKVVGNKATKLTIR